MSPATKINVSEEFQKFLEKFGYLKKQISIEHSKYAFDINNIDSYSEAEKEFAIRLLQLNYGLLVNGIFTEDTLHTLSESRCGNYDAEVILPPYDRRVLTTKRTKRFSTDDSSWGKNEIKYDVKLYSKKMEKNDVDRAVQSAFMVWSRVTHLTFTRVTSESADIDIYFVTGEHGDSQPMDGKGGILAHAFSPKYGGDIHFDDDEAWVVKRGHKGVTNFYQVAVHEIGHALGLAHSTHKESVMYPSYKGYEQDYSLSQDDINGITSKYGGMFYKGANDVERCILP